MKKHKSKLLISISILLVSCAPGVPEPPEALKVMPLWQGSNITGFHGKYMKANEKVTLTLPRAKEFVLVCSDIDTETAYVNYVKELEALAKQRCR